MFFPTKKILSNPFPVDLWKVDFPLSGSCLFHIPLQVKFSLLSGIPGQVEAFSLSLVVQCKRIKGQWTTSLLVPKSFTRGATVR